MKRARSEQMQALILSYLKKRNYTDSEASFRAEYKFEESMKEMSSRCTLNADLSTPNTVCFTVSSINEYFTEFTDMIKFASQTPADDNGIRNLLYPIFCHLYLDLVTAGRKADAGMFLTHFDSAMRAQEVSNPLPSLDELSQVIQPSDITTSKQICELRRKKCTVDMCNDAHALLLRYLQAAPSLLLIKIINLHIYINIKEHTDPSLFDLFSNGMNVASAEIASDGNKNTKGQKTAKKEKFQEDRNGGKQDMVTLSAPSLLSPPTPVTVSVDPNLPHIPEVDLNTLRTSIQNISESKPTIQNICLHRLQNSTPKGLTHTTFSNGYQSLSMGFEDSTAVIWDLSEDRSEKSSNEPECNLRRPNERREEKKHESTATDRLSPDVSKIHLACDFYEHVKARLEVPNTRTTVCNQGKVFRAHSGTVYSSCFSHDDRYLLTCAEDTTVRLWDARSSKNKVVYRGHAYPVWCIGMSSYSLYFASGSHDRTARLWTTERTYPLRTFAGHHGGVESVAFHGNATYLATADKTIRLWDISSGKTVRLMLGHWASVACLSFSPNGKYLASSGEDGRIRMWDIASGALIKEMRGHNGTVYSLDFSPDGAMLASGGSDHCLRVWNTRTTQSPSTRSNTDTSDETLNPDLIGKWHLSPGTIHTVKFEACNLLHCVFAES